jgi:Family of unknown function (DUF6804)
MSAAVSAVPERASMIVKCPKGHQNRIPDGSPPQTKYRCPVCKNRIEVVWAPGVSNPPSPTEEGMMWAEVNTSPGQHKVSKIPAIVSICFLLLAAFAEWRRNPGFYTLVRFAVCGSSVYLAWGARLVNQRLWVWVMGATAVLFNPIIPIVLDRGVWRVIDFIAAIVFAVSLATIRAPRTKTVPAAGGNR